MHGHELDRLGPGFRVDVEVSQAAGLELETQFTHERFERTVRALYLEILYSAPESFQKPPILKIPDRLGGKVQVIDCLDKHLLRALFLGRALMLFQKLQEFFDALPAMLIKSKRAFGLPSRLVERQGFFAREMGKFDDGRTGDAEFQNFLGDEFRLRQVVGRGKSLDDSPAVPRVGQLFAQIQAHLEAVGIV